ncbi:hypothetical protein HPB47_019618 [Ixodes persulcatus]|uniref:Uncharacterized protein n=1 Tax=Ixodes persulcatus TaxID=34615 RepID=A0AC60QL86_IXOPE|nr:hypothetical protein HPB47_019618 [Ixodes persulcatus]
MESTKVIMPTDILTNSQNEVTITPKPTCPWGKVATTPEAAVSFADVMSEELARALEETELVSAARRTLLPLSEAAADQSLPETDCSDDHTLALLLQSEYDKEHDTMLCREERKFNGESKVSISFGNYKRLPEHLASDSDDEEDALDGGPDVARHWDSFERAERSSPAIGRSGVARQAGGGFTTKHDATVCGRRNACRVMELPPGISTGDGGGFDMRLSNHVYNSLKVHSAQEGRRAARLHDKREKATAVSLRQSTVVGCSLPATFDLPLFLDYAPNKLTEEFSVPRECAVKVFKTTLNEFKNREQYIREDFRFKDRFSKLNPRKVIHLWAEKEMHNLRRMRRAGIPCPEVVVLKKHLLVMSFVGLNGVPAPQLKEAALSGEQLASAYAQAVALARALYQRCQLVHADLSEYNLLWHQGQVLVIDVSQAVDRMHPHALEFLLRDCTNISRFFQKQGLPNVLSPKDLFTEVCGLNLPGEGAELLSQIQNYERDEQLLGNEQEQKVDLFDTLFQKSMDKKSRIGNETASSKDNKEESEESDDDVLED